MSTLALYVEVASVDSMAESLSSLMDFAAFFVSVEPLMSSFCCC